MLKILAICGSPRRKGNTAVLLEKAIEGARESGAEVSEVVLRDLRISPCLEIYGCRKEGQCAIKDDFQDVVRMMQESDGIILASPVFFYSVSAHTKILIDRCQSLWVRKYLVGNTPDNPPCIRKKGLFISLGATKGKKLFDGVLLTTRYFFDAIDTELWKALLYRNIDFEGDILKHPEYINEAYCAGKELAEALNAGK